MSSAGRGDTGPGAAGAQVAVPRMAATVMLFRSGAPGAAPEVLLLRRNARTAFAASQWVFPGGAVDPGDRTLDPALWRGIDPAALGERVDQDAATTLGLWVAAARETFEEAGVLLATRADGGPLAPDDPAVVALRKDLAQRDADFAAGLRAAGAVLDLAALTPFRRWITPEAEPRRYDTLFLIAEAPPGQAGDHDGVEMVSARWLTAADALVQHAAGELPMIYPTIRTLEEVAAAADLAALRAAAAARGPLRPLQPTAVLDGLGRIVDILRPEGLDP
jgi:8-oxo-dGTP pyrophosphatase MutT (NUDIX family)